MIRVKALLYNMQNKLFNKPTTFTHSIPHFPLEHRRMEHVTVVRLGAGTQTFAS